MNHLIVFMFVITMILGRSEGCKKNRIVFRNELVSRRVLQIICRSSDRQKRNEYLDFNAPPFFIEFSDTRNPFHYKTQWDCQLNHGPGLDNSYYDIQVYKAANVYRCGQLREWVARVDGIYFRKDSQKPLGWVLPWKKR
ncbi:unnamed protein product [Cochlearia groenlandica]